MALYEHVFLARQDLSAQQVDALVEQYKGIIEAHEGSVGRVENWGLKSLTYRINKNRKAYYTLMDITAPAAAVQEMERQMGLSEDILRFMTIKVEAHEEGPSAMMQKRDRDDRKDRDSWVDECNAYDNSRGYSPRSETVSRKIARRISGDRVQEGMPITRGDCGYATDVDVIVGHMLETSEGYYNPHYWSCPSRLSPSPEGDRLVRHKPAWLQ